MCTVLLPPGANPNAFNKYIEHTHTHTQTQTHTHTHTCCWRFHPNSNLLLQVSRRVWKYMRLRVLTVVNMRYLSTCMWRHVFFSEMCAVKMTAACSFETTGSFDQVIRNEIPWGCNLLVILPIWSICPLKGCRRLLIHPSCFATYRLSSPHTDWINGSD